MEFVGYLGAMATGVSLGLIGGGGSILIVPVLVYLFHVNPALATAYSLFTVGAASSIGAFQYARKGLVDYKTAVIFAVPAFIGVFLARRYLVPSLPEVLLSVGSFAISKDAFIMLVFAVVMLAAAVAMITKKTQSDDSDQSAAEVNYNYPMIGLEGLLVGGVTGLVGAGGGFLIIPALVLLARLPMKLAVGTSLVIIAAKSLLGFLGDLAADQQIAWELLTAVTVFAVVGIFFGSYLSKFIPGKKLQPAFGWFVLVMGVSIMAQQVMS